MKGGMVPLDPMLVRESTTQHNNNSHSDSDSRIAGVLVGQGRRLYRRV